MATLTSFAFILFAVPALVQDNFHDQPKNIFTSDSSINKSSNLPIVKHEAATSTWTGAINNDWNTAGNWDAGAVPVATTAVIIPSGTTYSPSVSNAEAVAASVTINNGAVLSMSGTYNLTMSSGGVFTNNGTFSSGSGTGAVVFAGTATVNGASSTTFNNITINGDLTLSTTSTINGTLLINSGTVSAAPVYGSSSTLIYNTSSATYTVGKEWNVNTTSGSAGTGNPQNVTIQNANIILMPNGDRRVPGNLTISSGGLTLSSNTNKDLYIGGNWTNNGTFTHNNRKVTLNGSSGTQVVSGTGNNSFYDLTISNSGATSDFSTSSITIDSVFRVNGGTMDGNTSTFIFKGSHGVIAGSGTKRFYNLQINTGANVSDLIASAGDIHVANSYVNNGAFTQDSSHTIFFDKSAATETLSGNGITTFGNITIGGPGFSFPTILDAGSHSFTVCGRSFKFGSSSSSFKGNTSTVTFALSATGICIIKNSGSASGTSATFYNVAVSSGSALTGIDFGNGISTITNNLSLNTLGYVTGNAPKYASSSTLIYNTTSNPYTVGTEWTGNGTTAGTGIPQNVTIQNTNTVTMPNSDRGIAGNININSGTLSLGSGDLYIAGNWYKATGSVFTPNSRVVIFNGSTQQIIGGTGATIFDNLTNSNAAADLVLNVSITINSKYTAGNNTNLSLGNNTITLAGTVAGSGTLAGTSSSNLIIQGSTTPLGTLIFKTGYQTLNTLALDRTGISGNYALALGSDLCVSNLTLTAGILATGTHLFSLNSAGNLTAPNTPWTSNNTNHSDSYIATCNIDGSALNITAPFAGEVGFKMLQVGSTADSSYFPVGADLNSANRMLIKMNGSAISDFTVVVYKGDIGNTPGPRINRIWYVSTGNTTGIMKCTMRLFFTKRDWTTWPAEDEAEMGYDFGSNYFVQKDYGNNNYFISKACSTDIQNFSTGYLYNTEIYAQYSLNVSSAFDGSKNGITQFNKFAIVNGADVVLPIFIQNLKVWVQQANIKLEWTIVEDANFLQYVIEKSTDGVHFYAIGSMPAADENLSASYHYFDEQPSEGKNFYRITMIDKNAIATYSAVVMAQFESKLAISLYPNPATHIFNLQLNNMSGGSYMLSVFDVMGRLIVSKTIQHTEGSSTERVVLPANTTAGIYKLLVTNAGRVIYKNSLIIIE